MLRSMKNGADQPGGANEAGPTRHRFRLAQWVERLKAQPGTRARGDDRLNQPPT